MISNDPSAVLSSDEIDALVDDIIAEGRAGRKQTAWQKAQPLRRAQARQLDAAMALLWVIYEQSFQRELAIDLLSEIAESHDRDLETLSRLGACLEAARDIDDLNAPPPNHPLFHTMVERLETLAKIHEGQPEQEPILRGLAASARMLSRQRDTIAESCYRKLTEISPQNSAYHYQFGPFL